MLQIKLLLLYLLYNNKSNNKNMSRFITLGTNPKTQKAVSIAYGYDRMIHMPGYFIQAFDKTNPDICLLDAGALKGLNKLEFIKLIQEWKVQLPKHHMQKIALAEVI